MNFIRDDATGLIGHRRIAHYEHFCGSDDEIKFQKNLETQPEDWVYRNTKIVYDRNPYGHRSVHMSEIKQDGFLLTTGCSFTEGIGLPLEWTWPHVLSGQLGLPYYNLGLSSSGPDLAIYNLCRFLTACPHTPGYIVMMLPPPDRMFVLPNGIRDEKVQGIGPWVDSKFYEMNVKFNSFDTNLLKVDAVWKTLKKVMTKTKFVFFTFRDVPPWESELDFARDLMHRGPLTNQCYVRIVLDLINQS
jgi:hypothetical protein